MDGSVPHRIAVLLGGRSAEREVSLNTGAQVARALEERGHEVAQVDTGGTGFIETLRAADPEVGFICLHGRFGEDGTIQGLLELLDMPYVGSGVMASALAMNKVMSKKVFAMAGLTTPEDVVLRRGEPLDEVDITRALGPRTVVKPSGEGSSVGMTIVHEPAELSAAIAKAFAHDPLGCAGMSRSDTIVTPDGRVLLLETNTIPGMTATSLLPDAAAAAGIAFPDLCERLVSLALDDWTERRG